MSGGIAPTRILILHTDAGMRHWAAQSLDAVFEPVRGEVEEFDGRELDHETALSLLARQYDAIFLNLRLPYCLSVRMAELAHLARVNTRMVLISGAAMPAEFFTPLFDYYIPVPCAIEELVQVMFPASQSPLRLRRRLPTFEHVDAAIQAVCGGVCVADRSSAYEAYRDYFQAISPGMFRAISPNASLAQRLHRLYVRTPADFRPRLERAAQQLAHCRHSNHELMGFMIEQLTQFKHGLGPYVAQAPSASRELVDCLESMARMMAGEEWYDDTAELRDSLHKILADSWNLGPLTRSVENVLKVLATPDWR